MAGRPPNFPGSSRRPKLPAAPHVLMPPPPRPPSIPVPKAGYGSAAGMPRGPAVKLGGAPTPPLPSASSHALVPFTPKASPLLPQGISWPGGSGHADTPEPKANAKASNIGRRPPSSSGGGGAKKAMEKYSSSYTSISLVPNFHIAEWLHHILPDRFTKLFLGKCSRDALLSYLFLATGLVPADRLPSFYKQEVLDAILAEYERLGRPLDDADLTPDAITEFVGSHFASGGGMSTSFGVPPRPPTAGAAVPSGGDEVSYFYTTSVNHDGQWVIHAFTSNGEHVHSQGLPNPGHPGYYMVMFDNGWFLQIPGQAPVPCEDVFIVESESAPPLPPGTAAHSSLLPGMAPVSGGQPSACLAIVPMEADEEDFSPAEPAASDPPEIVQNPDGSQTLVLSGMGLDLPAEAQWRLSLEADGEYYVTADGRTSKAVSKLMRLKRVRKVEPLAPAATPGDAPAAATPTPASTETTDAVTDSTALTATEPVVEKASAPAPVVDPPKAAAPAPVAVPKADVKAPAPKAESKGKGKGLKLPE